MGGSEATRQRGREGGLPFSLLRGVGGRGRLLGCCVSLRCLLALLLCCVCSALLCASAHCVWGVGGVDVAMQ